MAGGDHGLALLLACPFVDVEELVEEIRSDVFGLRVNGARVFGRTETTIGDARRTDFLVELVADGPTETLEEPESS